jgi:hypothetical protein
MRILTFALNIITFGLIKTLVAIIMKHIYFLFIAIASFFFGTKELNAQKEEVFTYYGTCDVDGLEEESWDWVDPVYLTHNFGTELPTVTAYWKALWDDTYIYVLIRVEDDDHWPAWESGGNSWEYDKPEIYLDINEVLEDGLGPSTPLSGHYQLAPGFEEDGYGIAHTAIVTPQAPGGIYAYTLTGETYVYEQAIDISSLVDKDGRGFENIGDMYYYVGFDVTVNDQDEGFTTSRQRAIWQSGDGSEEEAWNNMDFCGIIEVGLQVDCWDPKCYDGIKNNRKSIVTVHPNPVINNLTIEAAFDRVVIYDMLGHSVCNINGIKTGRIDVGDLPKGLFLIKVYKKDSYLGSARILKK